MLKTTNSTTSQLTWKIQGYPGENWNRVECYQNMGFDEFLDQDNYEGSEELRNYVSDQADYQKLIQVVEAKENPEDKLFIFNVTMQNHGGYVGTYDNFEQEVWLTGEYEGKYPKTDQYPVSYTHLDVYKRQTWEILTPTTGPGPG